MHRRFARLYPYLWRYRRALAVGLVCLLASNYLEIQAAVLMGVGIDTLGLRLGPFGGAQDLMLTAFVGLTLAIAVGGAVSRFWMRKLMISASRHVEFDFRNDLFSHLLGQSSSFYDRYRTGDLMSRATSDIDAIRTIIGPAIMYIANTGALLPMAVVKMSLISPLLTGIVWLPLVLLPTVFFMFKRQIHDRFKRSQELMSDLSTNIQEMLSGVRIIKSYGREDEAAERFDRVSDQYVHENMRLAAVQSVLMPLLTVIVGFSLLALIWGGSVMIIRGDLTLGNLVTFFILLMASVWPMIAFGWVAAQIERGAASMRRLDELFEEAPEILEPATPADTPERVRGHIVIRDLTFHYPTGEVPALHGIRLDVPAGQTLGLTGPVGCGKSTLAQILARRYNPPRGTVFIDGVDILDWPVAWLRAQIGIVDQEPFLFSDTIESNIGYGLDGRGNGAFERDTRRAAEVAQLAQAVRDFPFQYATILGERGINLSGGQRQRTALARAIARDPGLLILDDALAAVDTHTEEAILKGLAEVLEGRTTILISHRITTVSLADRIVYLEGGRVVEQGTHEQLIAARGHYWALARRQQLTEEIDLTA